MKTITLLLLTIFMAKGCSQDMENTKIQYVANTRGSFQKITVQNQEISVSRDRGDEGIGETTKLSDDDWKALVKLFSKVELDSLSSYKAPTEKRFYDGAAMATMMVNYKEKEYQTVTFDHGNPPLEIEEFVNKIVKLGTKEE